LRAPNPVLAKLEAQDRGQTARALADDLPLFRDAVARGG
jgi:hypothetical protein